MSAVKNDSSEYKSTYYEILGLSETVQGMPSISLKTLRAAYRRTLLENHPDKTESNSARQNSKSYSIDQITQAFSTLLNPATRSEYDNELKIRHNTRKQREEAVNFLVGMEMVDLDDMIFSESNGTWYKSCRCGNDKGFLIQEKDLEAGAHDREIIVECRGCSLTLKVLFWVNDEE